MRLVNDMEDKRETKEEHIMLLEEKVSLQTLLTARVKKKLMENELQIEEFDDREVTLRENAKKTIFIMRKIRGAKRLQCPVSYNHNLFICH